MRSIWIGIATFLLLGIGSFAQQPNQLVFFTPDNPRIQYTGRIDFTNRQRPRFWQPGVYFSIRFQGPECRVVLNDEVLWGVKHNYIEVVLDGQARRLQTRSKWDTIIVGTGLSRGIHELTLCKNTEANIGYLELVAIGCGKLLDPPPLPSRKIECIGNSITCGTGSDASAIPCGKGLWEDQHNAYFSYGAVTARALHARYQLSAVSGIGLMQSCCNLEITMPQVFDKVSMRENRVPWDFRRYLPDVVTISLGQNDGFQDSATFCRYYIAFLNQLRKVYHNATLICLTSPMADLRLAGYMKRMLTAITEAVRKKGDKKVFQYFFSKQYHQGCDGHPSLAEHRLIAAELTAFIKKTMRW